MTLNPIINDWKSNLFSSIIQHPSHNYDTFGSKSNFTFSSTEIEIENSQTQKPFTFSTASDFHQNLHSLFPKTKNAFIFQEEKDTESETNDFTDIFTEEYQNIEYQTSENTPNFAFTPLPSPIYTKTNQPSTQSSVYSKYGRLYRKTCYSTNGLLFTIILNLCMITINTFLLIYEFYLIFTHGFILYSNFKLPLYFIVFDICLTFILFVEITLHLSMIYKCQFCEYMKYGNEHKIDILVFCVSLFLCVFSMNDMFGISDFDNIGFLFVRILRDVLRFVRCLIFGKFLYDSIIAWQRPRGKCIIDRYGGGCVGSDGGFGCECNGGCGEEGYLSSDWDDVKYANTNCVCI